MTYNPFVYNSSNWTGIGNFNNMTIANTTNGNLLGAGNPQSIPVKLNTSGYVQNLSGIGQAISYYPIQSGTTYLSTSGVNTIGPLPYIQPGLQINTGINYQQEYTDLLAMISALSVSSHVRTVMIGHLQQLYNHATMISGYQQVQQAAYYQGFPNTPMRPSTQEDIRPEFTLTELEEAQAFIEKVSQDAQTVHQ